MRRDCLLVCTVVIAACSPAVPPQEHDHAAHSHGQEATSGAALTYRPGEDLRIVELPAAGDPTLIDVRDGDTIRLDPTLVRRNIDGADVLQYGYNGQVPGPTIRVRQGSTFTVETTNRIDQPTTIHWHGVRVDNRFDGVPGLTQEPIEPGASFTYSVTVPDAGAYWYHPHLRTDVQLDLGLYGTIVVMPEGDPSPPSAPTVLLLDDILLEEDGSLAPYGTTSENHALMGRFGNRFLVNGDIEPSVGIPSLTQRLYVTNAASARTYRLSIDGAPMRLVGGDVGFSSGRDVDEIILAPGERVIIDVVFPAPGSYALLHRGPDATRTLAALLVAPTIDDTLSNTSDPTDIPNLEAHRVRPPDHTLRISSPAGHVHGSSDADGIEWEDTMPQRNAASHKGNTAWRFVDDDTGKINMEIAWTWQRGDLIKIRVKNDFESMQHPVHFHGQRFVVLASNGNAVDDRQWKDTYLLRAGETTDILLEASNPGRWMFHCHILEHAENGMMGTFTVE